MIISVRPSVPAVRGFKRWEEAGVAEAISRARSTFISQTLSQASNPGALKGGKVLGSAVSEIVYELKRFIDTRKNKEQSVVVSGTCKLARENTNGLKGMMALPVPLDLSKRILVFTGPEGQEAARRNGADIVGAEDLVPQLLEDKLQFDWCIASTDQLQLVTKLARILGPKGLMPSAKAGTLTNDIARALKDARTHVPYRIEKFSGNFNIPVAKVRTSPITLLPV